MSADISVTSGSVQAVSVLHRFEQTLSVLSRDVQAFDVLYRLEPAVDVLCLSEQGSPDYS